jgi:hypothetical protein
MNDEEINRAIAEHLGWIVPDGCVNCRTRPDGKMVFFNPLSEQDPLPNYCGDLNAMHEAEKALTKKDLWEMTMQLCNIVYGDVPLAHATAPQRAEAFLRTVGKWRGGA